MKPLQSISNIAKQLSGKGLSISEISSMTGKTEIEIKSIPE
jgi:hypothetical protein